MKHRKSIIQAVAVSLLSGGAAQISNGQVRSGAASALTGLFLVYWYEYLQEQQISFETRKMDAKLTDMEKRAHKRMSELLSEK